MMLSQAGILGKVDHDRVREIVTMAIIEHDLPYSFFESKRMMELQKYLNPDFEHVSRETAMSYVCEFYISQKGKLKQIMLKSPSRICLTFDCWTTITSERYVCLTAHFVDENWKLNSKILAFCKMKPPYREFELAKNVHRCLMDWGIDKKLFSITLDNALMNGKMKDILKKRLSLQNSLICNGDFFHLGCCADILNLIVQEGLKVISIALQNIRGSIKYVKASEARIINFRQCVEHVGDIDTSMDLQLDVSTEWTSTYAMLESGIRYRQAFARLALKDSNYKCCPSNEEWKRAEEICTFLEPLKGITNLMSRSSYPTLNMYFMKMSKIELSLKENVMNVDPKIKDMAHRMKEKFNKYWGDYSVIFALGTILDPRLKFELIKYCYSLLDPIICRAKIETIKKKLYFVYSQYEDTEASSSKVSISIPAVRNQPTVGACNEEIFAEAFGDKFDFKSRDTASAGKCELDKYLDEAILEPHSFEELDVLDYWKTNQIRFPHLSRMACDILSIPITTVANESVFGIGSHFLTKYRSCLLSNSDQALICIRNWLYGFKYNEDGIDDEDQDLNIISDDDEED